VAELAGAADANRAGGTLRDQQRPQRFDVAGAALRMALRAPRQRRSSRLDGVELVGLAVAAPLLAVRTVDLDHRDPRRREMPGQAWPVRAGPFNPTRSIGPNAPSQLASA
jgi:hypothetical protein